MPPREPAGRPHAPAILTPKGANMTLLRLSPVALSRCRFAISPLAETLGALMTLHRPAPDAWIAPWHARHQPAYRAWIDQNAVAKGLLSLVSATKWLPDVVALPPEGGLRTRLADELAVLVSHSDDQVRATAADAVAASWQPQDAGWLTLPGLAD